MTQPNYETIIECMKHGAPAIFPRLIEDFNQTVDFANRHIAYEQEKKRIEDENKRAEESAKLRKVETNKK